MNGVGREEKLGKEKVGTRDVVGREGLRWEMLKAGKD